MKKVFSTALAVALSLVGFSADAQITGTLDTNDERLQGATRDGKPLMFAPAPFQNGSSVSHWDVSATPNLLMEPSINDDLPALEVDLTDEVFQDLGWSVAETLTGPGPVAKAASFNIWSADNGFADPTPFAGAPGNSATTLGEARLNLFTDVLNRWGEILNSSVPIDVIVFWDSQECSENGAVLGAAGPFFIFYSEADEFPFNMTWYHAAQAESLLGTDETGSPLDGGGDIFVIMNAEIDNGCLGAGSSYYYGLDGNEPANQVDAATVILHELGHGLGFSTLTDGDTGIQRSGMPSAFDHFLYDVEQGKNWVDLTDAERSASAVSGGLAWSGAEAGAEAQNELNTGVPELTVAGSPDVAGVYDVGTASFGPTVAGPLTGELACFKDDEGSAFDACSAAVNADELAGGIALIDRGTCDFTEKVANAQAAGAVAAVIINNQGDSLVQMGGEDPSITIPAVSVGQSVGNALRNAACAEDNAVLLNGDRFQVTTDWNDGTSMQPADPVKLTDDTAYFWFFNSDNVEVVIKVLDACAINDHYWVFASGLTNVGVDLEVTDLTSGQINSYSNTLGQDFVLIKDTEAFDCP